MHNVDTRMWANFWTVYKLIGSFLSVTSSYILKSMSGGGSVEGIEKYCLIASQDPSWSSVYSIPTVQSWSNFCHHMCNFYANQQFKSLQKEYKNTIINNNKAYFTVQFAVSVQKVIFFIFIGNSSIKGCSLSTSLNHNI